MPSSSPFLQSSKQSQANSLAIIHLSRDNLVPIILRDTAGADDGYAEGAVLNSRFGSFPHSTLIGRPWGSQIRASAVDTGSRGRKLKADAKKRAAKKEDPATSDTSDLKQKLDNAEGDTSTEDFASKKPKLSPEGDTQEAPSGAQVKHENGDDEDSQLDLKRKREEEDEDSTKDRKRARMVDDEEPSIKQESTTSANRGERPVAEHTRPTLAAASGFVHMLKPSPELWTISLPHRTQVVYTPDYSYILQRIRAFPGKRLIEAGAGSGSFTHAAARAVFSGFPRSPEDDKGRVFSFEFNEARFDKMKEEITSHGLKGVVQISHRDVYNGGFNIDGKSPRANAVFLDLPAPWEALHHLSRRKPIIKGSKENTPDVVMSGQWTSPLDPDQSVHICTFSPCIEQVTKTVEALQELGWTDIDMVEISQRKFVVQRERIGLNIPVERGTLQVPANVEEAITKLQSIGERAQEYHAKTTKASRDKSAGDAAGDIEMEEGGKQTDDIAEEDEEDGSAPTASSKPWSEGRLVHRPEPELKTHTSYLVFAILPREWTEEDEAAALARWPCGKETTAVGILDRASMKKAKREQLKSKKKNKRA